MPYVAHISYAFPTSQALAEQFGWHNVHLAYEYTHPTLRSCLALPSSPPFVVLIAIQGRVWDPVGPLLWSLLIAYDLPSC